MPLRDAVSTERHRTWKTRQTITKKFISYPAGAVRGTRGPRWHCGRRYGAAPSCRAEYPLARKSLNWSLRRYVRASAPDVWLRRRAARPGCANAPACRRSAAGSLPAGGRPRQPGGNGRQGTASGARGRVSPGARVASAVRATVAAAESVSASTAHSSKRTYGTLGPGCGKPSRRCSARFGYHIARARGRRDADIGYFG